MTPRIDGGFENKYHVVFVTLILFRIVFSLQPPTDAASIFYFFASRLHFFFFFCTLYFSGAVPVVFCSIYFDFGAADYAFWRRPVGDTYRWGRRDGGESRRPFVRRTRRKCLKRSARQRESGKKKKNTNGRKQRDNTSHCRFTSAGVPERNRSRNRSGTGADGPEPERADRNRSGRRRTGRVPFRRAAARRDTGAAGTGSTRCCWIPCSWTPRRRSAPARRRPAPAAWALGTVTRPASPGRKTGSRAAAPCRQRQRRHWKKKTAGRIKTATGGRSRLLARRLRVQTFFRARRDPTDSFPRRCRCFYFTAAGNENRKRTLTTSVR